MKIEEYISNFNTRVIGVNSQIVFEFMIETDMLYLFDFLYNFSDILDTYWRGEGGDIGAH